MPAPADVTGLLRPGVLEGVVVAVSGAGPFAEAVTGACSALAAAVPALRADPADDEQALAAARALGAVNVLVCDAAGAFAAAGEGYPAVRAAADGAFVATRAVARAAWIDHGGGRAVLLAPPPGAGAHAGAARAALENLARTLSTEWARHAITVVAVLPGDATTAPEVGELCAFVASPAGVYFSGCAFRLGGPD